MSAKTDTLKKALIQALTKSLGNVSSACDACKCSRNTYYDYMKSDEQFAEQVNAIGERAIDFVEGSLFKQIQEGNTAATIFYLKTRAKSRGYVERQEIDHTTGGNVLSPQIVIQQVGALPPPVSREDASNEDI